MKQTQIAGIVVLFLGVLYVLLASQVPGFLAFIGNMVGGFLFILGVLAQFHKPRI